MNYGVSTVSWNNNLEVKFFLGRLGDHDALSRSDKLWIHSSYAGPDRSGSGRAINPPKTYQSNFVDHDFVQF